LSAKTGKVKYSAEKGKAFSPVFGILKAFECLFKSGNHQKSLTDIMGKG